MLPWPSRRDEGLTARVRVSPKCERVGVAGPLLKGGFIRAEQLEVLIGSSPMTQNERERITRWVRSTAGELGI